MSKGNSEASALTKFEVLGGGHNSGTTLLFHACSMDPRLVLMVSTEHSNEQQRNKDVTRVDGDSGQGQWQCHTLRKLSHQAGSISYPPHFRKAC